MTLRAPRVLWGRLGRSLCRHPFTKSAHSTAARTAQNRRHVQLAGFICIRAAQRLATLIIVAIGVVLALADKGT